MFKRQRNSSSNLYRELSSSSGSRGEKEERTGTCRVVRFGSVGLLGDGRGDGEEGIHLEDVYKGERVESRDEIREQKTEDAESYRKGRSLVPFNVSATVVGPAIRRPIWHARFPQK